MASFVGVTGVPSSHSIGRKAGKALRGGGSKGGRRSRARARTQSVRGSTAETPYERFIRERRALTGELRDVVDSFTEQLDDYLGSSGSVKRAIESLPAEYNHCSVCGSGWQLLDVAVTLPAEGLTLAHEKCVVPVDFGRFFDTYPGYPGRTVWAICNCGHTRTSHYTDRMARGDPILRCRKCNCSGGWMVR